MLRSPSIFWTINRFYSSGRLNLAGIMPPIPTPFKKDETIAYDKLQLNLEAWKKIPFSGYVVQGSNGEYPLLENSDRVEMISRVRQQIPENMVLVGGSTSEGTVTTILLSNEMAAAGANAVLVTTPSYYKGAMTDAALESHYIRLADECNVPVILYNMPANTNIDLSINLVTKLAKHPNIIGLKDSGGDIAKISRIVKETKDDDFQVLAGSVGFLLPALLIGCVGGINGLANILGAEVCNLYQLCKDKKFREAVELHMKLVVINSLVTRELGVSGMKAALDLVGLYGGPCRRPLEPLTDQQFKQLQAAFKSEGYC